MTISTEQYDAVEKFRTWVNMGCYDTAPEGSPRIVLALLDTFVAAQHDPIVERPDGRAYLILNELDPEERSYFIRHRGLTPEQQKKLHEFAAYLQAKTDARGYQQQPVNEEGAK